MNCLNRSHDVGWWTHSYLFLSKCRLELGTELIVRTCCRFVGLGMLLELVRCIFPGAFRGTYLLY